MAGLPIPLIATQLLWINLLTDTLPAVALGMDPGDRDVMKEKPRPLNEHFFSRGAGRRVVLAGMIIGLLTVIAFVSGYYLKGYTPYAAVIPEQVHEYARTLAFLTIIGCQLLYSFSFRHERRSIFRVGFLSNNYLFGAVLIGFALQLLVLYVPFMADAFKLQAVGLNEWLWVLALSVIPLLANEMVKLFARKKD